MDLAFPGYLGLKSIKIIVLHVYVIPLYARECIKDFGFGIFLLLHWNVLLFILYAHVYTLLHKTGSPAYLGFRNLLY